MAALYFPEALNQGQATLAQLLRGQAIILCACVFLGFLGYAATLVALGMITAFAGRLPFSVMHRASMTVGIGAAALIELYLLPSYLLHRMSDLSATLGIGLALLGLVIAIGIAIRLVLRRPSAVAGPSLPSEVRSIGRK